MFPIFLLHFTRLRNDLIFKNLLVLPVLRRYNYLILNFEFLNVSIIIKLDDDFQKFETLINHFKKNPAARMTGLNLKIARIDNERCLNFASEARFLNNFFLSRLNYSVICLAL